MTQALDIIIIVVLIVAIGMIVTGNSDRLWGLFSGKHGQNIYEVYDRDLFNRACLIFFSVLLVDELAIIFLSHTFPVMALISFGVTVVAFIAFVIYLRKIARK